MLSKKLIFLLSIVHWLFDYSLYKDLSKVLKSSRAVQIAQVLAQGLRFYTSTISLGNAKWLTQLEWYTACTTLSFAYMIVVP